MSLDISVSSKGKRKLIRKQIRCRNMLLKHEGLEAVDTVTKCIFVGNGGLVCGIQRETLMELFSIYGIVEDIVTIRDKPYSFVIYKDESSSEVAFQSLNGYILKSKPQAALYLCYVNDVPKKDALQNRLPPGLLLIPNFVTSDEEQVLLDSVKFDDEAGVMKHRRVKHFGYEFKYSNNNVDKNKPLDVKIPEVFHKHLQRMLSLGYISKIPDQLTVNQYIPGQGIPPHIDTHSAFEDEIVSLSLGSQVVMDFYAPGNDHIPVLLPQRSLLVMKGESRYLWKHGITPRKTDVIPVVKKDSSYHTLSNRQLRTSFTFRCIRNGSCNCEFAKQCDSQKLVQNTGDSITEEQAQLLEKQYVTQVYEGIADHFSETRFKPWPQVAKFIDGLPVGSILIDAGCGNGKNMSINSGCFQVGCDVSMNLAKVCADRKLEVVVGDVLSLPFRDQFADVCICIAVIHHMSTKARRRKAVSEIARILSPGGRALIYVWALEQETSDCPSNYLNYNKVVRQEAQKYELQTVSGNCHGEDRNSTIPDTSSFNLPIHENRTNFQSQDVFVPWHKKCTVSSTASNPSKVLYHRYYHVFVEKELEALISENDVEITKSYYDKGNWCVEFQKPVNK